VEDGFQMMKINNEVAQLLQLLQESDISSMAGVVEDRLQDYSEWVQPRYEGEAYSEGYGECLRQAVSFLYKLEELKSRILDFMAVGMDKVIIGVRGGVAYVETCPEGIEVEIIDYDNQNEN
jgi:hypothetical protein